MTPQEQEYRMIPLSQGQWAIVDVADFEWLNQWKWFAHFEKNTGRFYAARNAMVNGKKTLIWMHRQILGLVHGDGKIGDHREFTATLDNRRSNLRIATHAQNVFNRGRLKSNKAGVKGISLNNGSYMVRIGFNGATIYVGRRKCLEAARALYKEAALKYHGEFARFDDNSSLSEA